MSFAHSHIHLKNNGSASLESKASSRKPSGASAMSRILSNRRFISLVSSLILRLSNSSKTFLTSCRLFSVSEYWLQKCHLVSKVLPTFLVQSLGGFLSKSMSLMKRSHCASTLEIEK